MDTGRNILIVILIGIVLFLLTKVNFANKAEDDTENNVNEAAVEIPQDILQCENALQDGDYRQALICYGNVTEKYKRNDLRLEKAKILITLNKKQEAKIELYYILQNEKKDKTTYYNAKKYLKYLESKNPSANVLSNQNTEKETEKYEKSEIGQNSAKNNNPVDEINAKESSREYSPNTAQNVNYTPDAAQTSHKEVAQCFDYYSNKSYAYASKCFGEMADKYNDNNLRLNQAISFANLQEYDKAIDVLNNLVTKEKDEEKLALIKKHKLNFEKQSKRVNCQNLVEKGLFENACTCYDNLVKSYNDNFDKLSKAQILYYELGEPQKAKTLLTEILKTEKDLEMTTYANQLLGKVNNRLDGYNQAQARDKGKYMSASTQYPIWEHPRKIKVYIDYSHEKADVLKRAFESWDNEARDTIDFIYVNNENQADITARITDIDETLKRSQNGDAVGVTLTKTTYKNNKAYIVNAEVLVSYNMKGYIKDKYPPRPTKEIYAIALHEVGHALGLDHSKEINDIMYHNTGSYAQQRGRVTIRDIATLKALYGDK